MRINGILHYIKSLHLIFVITWFAGLFYIPRLFVYQIEAFHKPSPEKEILGKQLKLMAKRLWFIITWPSVILATLFAIWLLILITRVFKSELDACKTFVRFSIVYISL